MSLSEQSTDSETNFIVEIHTDFNGLAALWPRCAAEADAVQESAATSYVFQTMEFITCWLETYGRAIGAHALFVLVSEADRAPLLLLPLTIVRQGQARILKFLDATACDYNAPALFPTTRIWTPATAAVLWTAVKAALPPVDLIVFEKMPDAVGERVNPLFLLSDLKNLESCHVNDLARPWHEVERNIHGLRSLRKAARGLERIAPIRLEIARTPDARAALLNVLLAQKQRRFEETQVPGFETHPEKRAFFEQATALFAARGGLHLSALHVGDKPIATLWGLLHERRYYALMIGFEAGAWRRYSPGRVLYLLVMEALHAEGCTILDLGIGDEPWKLAQCDRTIPLRMHIEIVGWRGRAHIRTQQVMAQLRRSRLWQRLRPYKWIILRSLRRPDA